MYYLATTDPRGAMGLGGKDELGVGSLGNYIIGMDYKTGKPAWKIRYPGIAGGFSQMTGLMATAGHLLFSSDSHGNFVARDAATGKPLWHAGIGPTSAPESCNVDGHQFVFVAAGDMIYAFWVAMTLTPAERKGKIAIKDPDSKERTSFRRPSNLSIQSLRDQSSKECATSSPRSQRWFEGV